MDGSLPVGSDLSAARIRSLGRMEADIAGDLRVVRQRMHDVGVTITLDSAERAVAVWFRGGGMVLVPPPGGLVLVPPPGGLADLPMAAVIERQAAANARRRCV